MAMYLPTSTAGYFVYGNTINENILKTTTDSPITYVVQTLITLHLLFGFVIVTLTSSYYWTCKNEHIATKYVIKIIIAILFCNVYYFTFSNSITKYTVIYHASSFVWFCYSYQPILSRNRIEIWRAKRYISNI
jgi:hypothetical protein